MKYSYVARQPILDRDKNTIGYELLFRDGLNNSFPEIDPDLATSRLLSDHFLSTHYSTLGDNLGFVNFPYQSLINRVPTLFPANNLIVEVLEDCPPTDELLDAIKEMAKQGYKIALDDFVPSKEWKQFLPYVSIIKFDIRIISIGKAKTFIDKIPSGRITFLAEKVETHEEFQQAKDAGFDYFQGYFFSKPEIIQRKALEPSVLTLIQLCKEVAKEDIDYKAIDELISTDISLSYKLLTFVNSSSTVSTKIASFKQALIYLGKERIRKFISLVAIASTQESKPDYLYGLSIQRARFCELLAARNQTNCIEGSAFLTGMFSLLDSLLDQPLNVLVDEMPIEEEVKAALSTGEGMLGLVLALVKAYEKADWDQVTKLSNQLGLSSDNINQSYDDAVKWTADLLTS
ncbi:EAL domain-containing protein [Vibrio sp. ZSDE26]|uniref:EAL domain-containing protein n=1 Tax=Vibrio amylolyticus TaxID=2847292 RepID=A0A9X1XFQ2_9VIBR|nr:EAL and HDOD domain-containing protein [Vibrio amylolyticus]MCK6261976.1 EAL domain-containing protein [Vibrio amylolyticus]